MYPFEGRKVHEALAMLLAYRLSLMSPQTFNWACNDDGLELLSDQPIDWAQIVDANLLDPSHLMDDLSAGFNASELVRRKFRDVATIAGLVSGISRRVVKERHSVDVDEFVVAGVPGPRSQQFALASAQDEMLADQLEFGRLLLWLQSMPNREVVHCTLTNRPLGLSAVRRPTSRAALLRNT